MRRVHPHQLWIGHSLSTRDAALLRAEGIRALVDVAGNPPPAGLTADFQYQRIPIADGSENSAETLRHAIQLVAALIRDGVPVMVACAAGMSRSPSIAAAGLALATGIHADECLRLVTQDAPSNVSPSLWAAIRRVIESK